MMSGWERPMSRKGFRERQEMTLGFNEDQAKLQEWRELCDRATSRKWEATADDDTARSTALPAAIAMLRQYMAALEKAREWMRTLDALQANYCNALGIEQSANGIAILLDDVLQAAKEER